MWFNNSAWWSIGHLSVRLYTIFVWMWLANISMFKNGCGYHWPIKYLSVRLPTTRNRRFLLWLFRPNVCLGYEPPRWRYLIILQSKLCFYLFLQSIYWAMLHWWRRRVRRQHELFSWMSVMIKQNSYQVWVLFFVSIKLCEIYIDFSKKINYNNHNENKNYFWS